MITKPFVGVLLMACAGAASAAEPACVVLEQGWVRLPPAQMAMAAGYGSLVNRCSAPVTVTGVSSSAFGDVSLHETTVTEGVSRMRAVATLPIAAGARVELKPGGLHLMLMEPGVPLKAGAVVPLRLRLEDGRTVDGSLQVRNTRGGGGGGAAPHPRGARYRSIGRCRPLVGTFP